MKTEMETTIILPYSIGQEVFYLKDNQLKSGKIWRIDVEVTENEQKHLIWFKNEDKTNELIRDTFVFHTKEQAILFVTSTIN
jgi:hypothetical protein